MRNVVFIRLLLGFMRALIYRLPNRVPILHWVQERRHKGFIIIGLSRGQTSPATGNHPAISLILRTSRPVGILLWVIVAYLWGGFHVPDVLLEMVFGLLEVFEGVAEVNDLGSWFLLAGLYIFVGDSVLDDDAETATGQSVLGTVWTDAVCGVVHWGYLRIIMNRKSNCLAINFIQSLISNLIIGVFIYF